MKHVMQKFFEQLLQSLGTAEWIGWRKSDGTLGTFVAYEAVIAGFAITVTKHDYRDASYLWQRKVLKRRGLTEKATHWVEFTVKDHLARFGRRTVLRRFVCLPENELYGAAEKIFVAIQEVGKMLPSTGVDRLSTEHSLLEVCAALKESTSRT